jgi:hypothetical protein
MKQYQRRQANAYPYFKLATFDERSFTFRDGKVAYQTDHEAIEAAKKPGKYRLSIVTENGRSDFEPFIK